jgi:hypothetical protein
MNTDHLFALLELRFQYREARDRVASAPTEEARQFWAARMAVAISELQHPDLVRAAQALAEGGV